MSKNDDSFFTFPSLKTGPSKEGVLWKKSLDSFRHQWSSFYCILSSTQLTLTFFKSKAEYEKGVPHAGAIDLRSAVVLRAEHHTRPVFRILAQSVEYLLAGETPEERDAWFKAISDVCSSAPTPLVTPQQTPRKKSIMGKLTGAQPSMMLAAGAGNNKRMSLRLAAFGNHSKSFSNLSPEIQAKQRFTVDIALKPLEVEVDEDGLLITTTPPKDKVFGVALDTVLEQSQRTLPYIVEKCIEYLSQPDNLVTEGLFRVPGNQAKVDELKAAFDCVKPQVDLSTHDPYDVAACLKLYLRELPVPLMTFALYSKFMDTQKIKDRDEQMSAIRTQLSAMPKNNYVLLRYLCQFLVKVAEQKATNMMGPNNLAIVFAPTIFVEQNATMSMMSMSSYPNRLTESFIENFDTLFPASDNSETTALGSDSPRNIANGTPDSPRSEASNGQEDLPQTTTTTLGTTPQ